MRSDLFQRIRWMVILWLARQLPDCKKMTRTLGDSLDRKLSFRERFVMRLHLFTCDACSRYLKQITFLRDAARAHSSGEHTNDNFAGARLNSSTKDRIKELLRAQSRFSF